jgi:hypothetical protein
MKRGTPARTAGCLEQRRSVAAIADELAVSKGIGHEVPRCGQGSQYRRALLVREDDDLDARTTTASYSTEGLLSIF